jgi:hypothetical protein
MRGFAIAVVVCVALAAAGGDTQSLVDAAKASKEKKKKSTTKVITNADLKKSKAVVAEHKSGAAPVVGTPARGMLEQHEAAYRERVAREEKITAATKVVAELERQLAAVEQRYYDEDDLDKRDRELVRRFNEVKSKLDAAKKDLEVLAPPGS